MYSLDISSPTDTTGVSRIVILISGTGSNLHAILSSLEKYQSHTIQVAAVIADRNARGLMFAQEKNIPTYIFPKSHASTPNNHYYEIDAVCQHIQPTLIVLAGFLGILPRWFTQIWNKKIINIHPSLLPKFGGKGMYGTHVHQAVLQQQEKESGCSVHWVIEEVDAGAVIAQKKVVVYEQDSVETLQSRVLAAEHDLYPQAILDLCSQDNTHNTSNTSRDIL